MFFIVDKRIPQKALDSLTHYGKVISFNTTGITYDAISCHPDIFFCRVKNQLIVAPNLPDNYKNLLSENSIQYIEGEMRVGNKYPESARYNAVVTEFFFIHNLNYTDPVISGQINNLDRININQGYSRCSLLPLKNNHFITSDQAIYKTLRKKQIDVLYSNPSGIILPGFKHGFIGGAFGVFENKVFVIGSLKKYNEGDKVSKYLLELGYQIIELYYGPLFDGGSIFIINN